MKTRWLALLMVLALILPTVAVVSADDPPAPDVWPNGYDIDPDAVPSGFTQAEDNTDCPATAGCVWVDNGAEFTEAAVCDSAWNWGDWKYTKNDGTSIKGYIGCKVLIDCATSFTATKPWKLSTTKNGAAGTFRCYGSSSEGFQMTSDTTLYRVANNTGPSPIYYARFEMKWEQVCIFNNNPNGWWCNETTSPGWINWGTTYGRQVDCTRHANPGKKHQTRHTLHWYVALYTSTGAFYSYQMNKDGSRMVWRVVTDGKDGLYSASSTLVPCGFPAP